MDDLDDSVDTRTDDVDQVAPPEQDTPLDPITREAVKRGQSADQAGGSVAETIRTTPES